MRTIERPQPGEYAPYTTAYFDKVPEGPLLEHMAVQMRATIDSLRRVPIDRLDVPHRKGEWTIKDIVQHITDDERIYAYRALRFGRGDFTELPSFDQDVVAAHAEANGRSLDDLIDEYESVRMATLTLFEGLPEAAMLRVGVANGAPMSVRATALHIAGHELHHLESIAENYGPLTDL